MAQDSTHNILFIQGGGDDGYKGSESIVKRLRTLLPNNYKIDYPEIKSDESKPDFGWIRQIEDFISSTKSELIIVAHSLGASMLLKYLSSNENPLTIKAVFLLATPFWTGNEDWKQGLKLSSDFAGKLPADLPLFFYHCKDDNEVPFEQFETYRKQLPNASFRVFETGDHLFDTDLSLIAIDITGD